MPATFQQLLGQIRSPLAFYSQGNPPSDGSGDGSGDGGGGGFLPGPEPNPWPSPGPIIIGGPGGGGGGQGPTMQPAPAPATQASWLNSLLQYFTESGCGIGDFLLRIAFFLLGLICIIGAIYLYKGGNPILQIPSKIAHHAGKAIATAAEAEGA